MEYYENRICFGYKDVVPVVMSYECLEKQAQRGRVERASRGGGEGGSALFFWDSLGLKYRKKYTSIYGDPAATLASRGKKPRLEMDGAARTFFTEYRYGADGADGTYRANELRGLSVKLVEEYVLNASVCRALISAANDSQILQNALGGRGGGRWAQLGQLSEDLRKWYGHTLPSGGNRLKKKLREFEKDGYESLVSGKVGNRNTVKITAEAGEWLVAQKRSRVPVLTDAQILERYNQEAAGRGWKEIRSQSGLSAWLNSAAVKPLWYDAVHGEQAARQKFGRKWQTLLPTHRDTLWYGDGTKLNLYYRDEDGHVRTTQVYEVIDAMSEVLLGYHISDTEDYEAQYHAYRMAIQVSGHRPYEVVHDNQGGHKKLQAEGLFAKICHVHRTTQPYNGESKTIESVFGRFQAQVLHKDWRFTGQNVTARKASSRPNLEFIEANKDSLYTLAELKDAYAKARKEWNYMVVRGQTQSRWARYQASRNEATPAVTVADMVEMFWVTADRMSTFTDSGLTLTVKGREYRYEVFSSPGVPDHEWRSRHTWERFVVKYDPYDMGSVRLYSKDKGGALRFEAVAEPYLVVHRAIQDQSAGDAKAIRQEQCANLRDRVERQVRGKAIEYAHGVAPEQHGLRTPDLKGVDAATQREVDRRTSRYAINPEEWQLGRRTKQVSLSDWIEDADDKASQPMRQVAASKL